jgi:hypothetical protein
MLGEKHEFHATVIPPATAEGTRRALAGVDRTNQAAVGEALLRYENERIEAARAAGQTLQTAEWHGREIEWNHEWNQA